MGRTQIRRKLLLGVVFGLGFVSIWVVLQSSSDSAELSSRNQSYRTFAQLTGNLSLPPSTATGESRYTMEIWARGPRSRIFSSSHGERVSSCLTAPQLEELRSICGRCLYHSLLTSIQVEGVPPTRVFVATGDIPDQWLRDSSVQLALYLPRLASHPMLKPVMAAAITTSAYYILTDPYANAFSSTWRPADSLSQWHRVRGRGGWTAERKWELDSGAYFMNLLWNAYHTPGAATGLMEGSVQEALLLMLKVWDIERHHERDSPYRFVELPRGGLGAPVKYTGMVWSGFRPSDDMARYGFNIPGNMYAAGALARLLELNRKLWRNPDIKTLAGDLLGTITAGLQQHAVVEDPGGGGRVYAYEVDGLGSALVDFDDPNLPSLLAIPLLGFEGYDEEVYRSTRERIWSRANPHFFSGASLEGMGSPHTPHSYVWPLAHMVRALTSEDAAEQAQLLQALLLMQCGDGLMHESVHVAALRRCTRPHFEWANAMFVVTMEQLLGWDCEAVAQVEHVKRVAARERGRWWWWWPFRQEGMKDPLMYERLEAAVVHHVG